MSTKFMNFLTFSWFVSSLICLVIQGAFFGANGENNILAGLSVLSTYNFLGVMQIPVVNADFWTSLVRTLTWDYSFYQGGYSIIRFFWTALLTPGAVWGIIQGFTFLYGTVISKLLPGF